MSTTTERTHAPSLGAFRDDVLAFLEGNAERRAVDDTPRGWGSGDDTVLLFDEADPEEDVERLVAAQAWMAKRFDAGFGWIAGPSEYGGRGLSRAHQRLYERLEAEFAVADGDFFSIGLGMVAPTILVHGTRELRRCYLAAMYRGDVIGCQLFSEPGAGSDLAGVSTKAARDGDEWVISGQKVWTSGAQYAHVGEILCRTDVDQPKHKGITAFVVDMHAPGVSVRPLRQMTGGSGFSEVFFDEVRVPDVARLGEVNGGWTVALTTLLNERGSANARGSGGSLSGTNIVRRVIEMLRHFDAADDPVLRQDVASVYTRFQVAKWNYQRAMARVRAGEAPGPELSGAKLARTHSLVATSDLVARILGPRLLADSGEWGTYAWNGLVVGVPGVRLAGGTDEIQRNIMGEQVLGLPKEPRDAVSRPFRETLQW